MKRRSILAACMVVAMALPTGAAGQTPGATPQTFSTQVEVVGRTVWLDVLDEKGRSVADISADMLKVFEDGVAVPVLEVRPRALPATRKERKKQKGEPVPPPTTEALPPPQRYVVVALDPVTLGKRAWEDAIEQLAASAEKLAAIGPVDVVALTVPPLTVVKGTRDPAEVRAALARVEAEVAPFDAFYRGRARLLNELQWHFRDGGDVTSVELAAQQLAADEEHMLRESLGRLQETMIDTGRPLIVIWAAQGDPDTAAFVLPLLPAWLSFADRLRFVKEPLPALTALENIFESWARDGVSVVTWSRPPEMLLTVGLASNPLPVDPRQALGVHAFALYQAIAEETGGAVVRTEKEIETALTTVGGRFELVYQSDKAGAGWRELRIEVTKPGWTARASPRQYVLASARPRSAPPILAVQLRPTAKPSGRPGRDNVHVPILVDLAPLVARLGPAGPAHFAIRLLATPPSGTVVAREVEVNAESLPGEGVLRYETELEVPHGTSGYVVEVRETTTGARGVAGPVEAAMTEGVAAKNDARDLEVAAPAAGRYTDSSEVVIAQARFLMPEEKAPAPRDIRVLWKKREQRLDRVVGGAGSPLELGIAIDVSESAQDERAAFAAAASEAAARLLTAGDRLFRVDFGTEARYVGAVLGGPGTLFAVMPSGPPEKTAIFDGLRFALERFEGHHDRAALVVFTDGCETAGRTSWRDVRKAARSKAIPVFVVVADSAPCAILRTMLTDRHWKDGTVSRSKTVKAVGATQSPSRKALAELADDTGGLAFSLPSPTDARRVWGEVERALGRLWVAVFEPSDPAVDGRHVEVRSASGALLRPSG